MLNSVQILNSSNINPSYSSKNKNILPKNGIKDSVSFKCSGDKYVRLQSADEYKDLFSAFFKNLFVDKPTSSNGILSKLVGAIFQIALKTAANMNSDILAHKSDVFSKATIENNEIIGGFAGFNRNDTFHIACLFVDKKYQRTKKSVKMIKQYAKSIYDYCQKNNIKKISWDVSETNMSGKNLFRRLSPTEIETKNHITACVTDIGNIKRCL